jgi:hypothetical protein
MKLLIFYLTKRKKLGRNIVLPEAAAWFSCAVALVLHKRQGIASPANYLLLKKDSDSSRLLVNSPRRSYYSDPIWKLYRLKFRSGTAARVKGDVWVFPWVRPSANLDYKTL